MIYVRAYVRGCVWCEGVPTQDAQGERSGREIDSEIRLILIHTSYISLLTLPFPLGFYQYTFFIHQLTTYII